MIAKTNEVNHKRDMLLVGSLRVLIAEKSAVTVVVSVTSVVSLHVIRVNLK